MIRPITGRLGGVFERGPQHQGAFYFHSTYSGDAAGLGGTIDTYMVFDSGRVVLAGPENSPLAYSELVWYRVI